MWKKCTIPLIFMVALLVPITDMLLKLDPFPHLYENRQMAKRPNISLSINDLQAFPREYTKYINDHFGFRNALIRLNFLIRYNLLKTSPSAQVVLGKAGWLFYSGEKSLEDFRGITTYDSHTLEKWAETLEIKRKWLAERGVKYLFIIAPNKETIYGEYLPERFTKIRNKTGLDELVAYVKKHTDVEILDLRESLFRAKDSERLYYKTDTHWNNYGAFLAYREIMNTLTSWYPQLHANSIEDFTIQKTRDFSGDLASLAGGSEFLKEENIVLTPKKPRTAKNTANSEVMKIPFATFTMEQHNSRLIRAITFRDSFFNDVIPYLSEHFQHNKYIWFLWDRSTPITELILSEKPDVVIEEVVERMIKRDMRDFTTNKPKFCEQ